MVRVWLVRHGETRWNTERRLQGISDIELSDRGREQAEQLRLRLGGRSFDAVWSSDLLRAVETAEIIFGGPRIDARLRELTSAISMASPGVTSARRGVPQCSSSTASSPQTASP